MDQIGRFALVGEGCPMVEDRAKAAVVGVGIWGQNHALVYNDYHRTDLKVICDQNPERAKEIADRYACDYTTDIEEVVNSDVDIVTIATPDHAHFEPALKAINAGKNVLIEKPMTTSLAEAKELFRAARSQNTKTMVDFQMRFNPGYMGVKEAILDNQLGKPFMGYIRLSDAIDVATTWFNWSGQSGPHWFLFPHTMDIMRWYLQEEPTEIYATGQKKVLAEQGIDTFDAVQAHVRFQDAYATFETSWIVPNSSPSVVDCYMSLYGTEGKVELDADYGGLAIAAEKYSFPWAPVGKRNMHGRLDHPLYTPIMYFVDCVIDDREPTPTLYDGLVNVAMIEAAVESAETGKVVALDVKALTETPAAADD